MSRRAVLLHARSIAVAGLGGADPGGPLVARGPARPGCCSCATWELATIWHGRVQIGDRLRFGAIDGRVADVRMFGITVIADDGARVFVPNAKLAGDTLSVASPRRSTRRRSRCARTTAS